MRLFIAANFPEESEVETSISANPLPLFLSFPRLPFMWEGIKENFLGVQKPYHIGGKGPEMVSVFLSRQNLLFMTLSFSVRKMCVQI